MKNVFKINIKEDKNLDDTTKKALKEFARAMLSAGVALLTTVITNCQL